MIVVNRGRKSQLITGRSRRCSAALNNAAEPDRKAFGEGLPMISGVAITIDTENAGKSNTVSYGDIVFRR